MDRILKLPANHVALGSMYCIIAANRKAYIWWMRMVRGFRYYFRTGTLSYCAACAVRSLSLTPAAALFVDSLPTDRIAHLPFATFNVTPSSSFDLLATPLSLSLSLSLSCALSLSTHFLSSSSSLSLSLFRLTASDLKFNLAPSLFLSLPDPMREFKKWMGGTHTRSRRCAFQKR